MQIQVSKEFGGNNRLDYGLDPALNYHSVKSEPNPRNDAFSVSARPSTSSQPKPNRNHGSKREENKICNEPHDSFREQFHVPRSGDLFKDNQKEEKTGQFGPTFNYGRESSQDKFPTEFKPELLRARRY
jgi:hypothetical protein